MNKAIFLDRDGTINYDSGYLYEVQKFRFLPGVIEGLQIMQNLNFMLFIITNQSGIARGYYTEENYYILTNYMLSLLEDYGIKITEILYCPHHPQGSVIKYRKECNCRKPGITLFTEVQKRWNIDFSQSYAIGDQLRDCAICFHSACKGYVLGIEQSVLNFYITEQQRTSSSINCAVDLLDAAKKIRRDCFE